MFLQVGMLGALPGPRLEVEEEFFLTIYIIMDDFPVILQELLVPPAALGENPVTPRSDPPGARRGPKENPSIRRFDMTMQSPLDSWSHWAFGR